eukprot:scaffold36782_cov66-Phaeocystis_antarctica.AAC.5
MPCAGEHISQIVLSELRLGAELKRLGGEDERLLGEQHGWKGLGQPVHIVAMCALASASFRRNKSGKAGLWRARLPALLIFNRQAVETAVNLVMAPIRSVVNAIKGVVDGIKKLVGNTLSGGRRLEEWTPARITRRLEELTPGEVAHVGTLETEASRQIIEVKGRLLQVDHDDAHAANKERLVRDVYRRMEAHLVKREMLVEDSSPLISMSSLKSSVNLNLDSKIEFRADKFDFEYQLPIPKIDFDYFVGLAPTPFVVKLSASFDMSGSCLTGVIGGVAVEALVHIVVSNLTVDFDLSSDAQKQVTDFSLGDWSQSKFELNATVRGNAYFSAQIKLRVAVKFSIALCLGPFCGGVQALGFWEVAKGYDMALVTSTADRTPWYRTPWSLESKLTKYAEYTLSDLKDIEDIMQGDHGGKTLMLGGSYMYMTVPYLRVEPMVSNWVAYLTSLEPFEPLLSFAGPADCKDSNYDAVNKTCKSDKTIKDTLLDQGWPGV